MKIIVYWPGRRSWARSETTECTPFDRRNGGHGRSEADHETCPLTASSWANCFRLRYQQATVNACGDHGTCSLATTTTTTLTGNYNAPSSSRNTMWRGPSTGYRMTRRISVDVDYDDDDDDTDLLPTTVFVTSIYVHSIYDKKEKTATRRRLANRFREKRN